MGSAAINAIEGEGDEGGDQGRGEERFAITRQLLPAARDTRSSIVAIRHRRHSFVTFEA
jgi:hypothetical protein